MSVLSQTHWDAARIAHLTKLKKELKLPNKVIADRLQISEDALRKALTRFKLTNPTFRGSRRPWTKDEDERLIDYDIDGANPTEIGIHLCRSRNSVRTRLMKVRPKCKPTTQQLSMASPSPHDSNCRPTKVSISSSSRSSAKASTS
jgi:hypothetical protein